MGRFASFKPDKDYDTVEIDEFPSILMDHSKSHAYIPRIHQTT
jgi:hypothetical protein